MTNLSLPKPHAHVIVTDFDDGEGVLIDVQARRYYQLNETALLIWRGLEQNQPLPQIISQLTASYEVSAEQAAESVRRLLAALEDHKLIGALRQ
ncbi:MAG: hypothetical protein HONDAALG_02104 [Gammaproteobacteria bacterium]|nr:hypothetical protein [Gammaproteobacteria bacterium]